MFVIKNKIREDFKENPVLNTIIVCMIIIFIIIQVVIIRYLNISQSSDYGAYLKLAMRSVKNMSMYPAKEDIYSQYLWAPGYINYLAMLLKVFNYNLRYVLYTNIVLNVILLWELYYLANYFFSKKVAKILCIVFCLYISNYAIVLFTATELPFVVLAFGALCMFVQGKKRLYIIAGIFLSLANWIRPLIIPFILAIIIIIIYKRIKMKNWGISLISLVITCLIIGIITYKNTGYFNYSSTTSGVNLMMGANKDATGSYNDLVFHQGNAGEIKSMMTFKEKDKFWKEKSVEWIKANPVQYIKLFPKKLYFMYNIDYSFVGKLANNDYNFIFKITNSKFILSVFLQCLQVITGKFNNLYYYLIITIFLITSIYAIFKRDKDLAVFISIPLAITGMTIVTVGVDRYHYPCIMAMLILVSYFINLVYEKSVKRFK